MYLNHTADYGTIRKNDSGEREREREREKRERERERERERKRERERRRCKKEEFRKTNIEPCQILFQTLQMDYLINMH